MPPKASLAGKRLATWASQIRSYSAPADRSIPAAKQKYIPTSGSYPKGFLAGSAFAGVKASNTKYDDLAFVASEEACPGGAVFTQNIFKAAPVQISRQFLSARKNSDLRGVVVNSGCANAVTGKLGLEHAETMAKVADKCFADEAEETPRTLVMSTGVIGQRLPIDRITNAIPTLHSNLGSSHDHWLNAAQAICTTDTFPKLLSRTFTLPSHPDTTYSIAGMTKGAGMIHPNMATLLGIVCTDVKIHPDSIQTLLSRSINQSFNCISIDGDTSTNDTVALFANGAAAPNSVEPLVMPESAVLGRKNASPMSDDIIAFQETLEQFFVDLAKLVVRDGEGATKFVTIRVRSDVSYLTAKRAAVSIARSALVKTALYGKDANWGRILCAIGYAPGLMNTPEIPSDSFAPKAKSGEVIHQVKPHCTSVSFVPTDGSEELKLLVRGEPESVDEDRAKQILDMEDLEILVRLEDDEVPRSESETWEAKFYTCDFSHEYVTINGDYRT